MKKIFGSKVRELRKRALISGEDLARRLECTQASISKIENGLTKPSVKLAKKISVALRLSASDRKELEELAAQILYDFDRWTFEESDQYSLYQNKIANAEEEAREYDAFTWNVIPGLLQSDEYIRAIADTIELGPVRKEKMLKIRFQRKEILKDTSKKFRFLLHEQTLYTRVSMELVHLHQLKYLRNLVRKAPPHIEVRILPRVTQLLLIPNLNFLLLSGSRGTHVLADQQYHTQFIWEPGQVSAYKSVFTELWDKANPILTEKLIQAAQSCS